MEGNQWGVELRKKVALEIAPAIADDDALSAQDASAEALIAYYRANRT